MGRGVWGTSGSRTRQRDGFFPRSLRGTVAPGRCQPGGTWVRLVTYRTAACQRVYGVYCFFRHSFHFQELFLGFTYTLKVVSCPSPMNTELSPEMKTSQLSQVGEGMALRTYKAREATQDSSFPNGLPAGPLPS